MRRVPPVPALLVVAALTLAGCRGDDSTGQPAGTSTLPAQRFSDVDVAFSRLMVARQRQAVEIADLASVTSVEASDPVRFLAERIRSAQLPDGALMTGWLQGWGVAVVPDGSEQALIDALPSDASADGETSGEGDEGGEGDAGGDTTVLAGPPPGAMVNGDEMNKLVAAVGPEFDRTWLLLMIRLHEGSLALARAEVAHGQDPNVTALATKIAADLEAEMAEMRALLG